jgi:hypothetical protein
LCDEGWNQQKESEETKGKLRNRARHQETPGFFGRGAEADLSPAEGVNISAVSI